MGGTLIVWKAPHPDDEDSAARLLVGYYATGDESAFNPSPDVRAFYRDVLALWPSREPADADDAPTWSSTPERSDRVVSLDYSWSAPDELLEDIDSSRRHKLVLSARKAHTSTSRASTRNRHRSMRARSHASRRSESVQSRSRSPP